MNTPELRFPEFTEAWQSKKMGRFAKFSKGKGISKSDISEDGETECIRYGELYTIYNEVIDKVYSRTNINHRDLILSEANDVIIPGSGETQIDIATASCVLKSGVALGGDLNIIKTDNNGVFLSYYLNNRKKTEIAKIAQGNSVVHLYSSQLATLNINLPSILEQQKIASFLTAVDDKLTQLKQKKSLLVQYKKGLIQKIFSREIRFKDENGAEYPDWEKKKIIDFAPLQRGFDLPIDSITKGEYPVVFSNGILKYHNEFKVKAPGIVTGRSGTIGKVTYVQNDYWPHNTSLWVTDFKGNFPMFIFHFFSKYKLERFGTGSGVPTLNRNDVHSQKEYFPALPEQTKIANFLSALDEKINHCQLKIEKTVLYKKGLLQKMFC